MNNIIITCGDINGIGPEISLKALKKIKSGNFSYTFICPKNIFDKSAQLVNFNKLFFASKSPFEINKSKSRIKILLLNNSKLQPGNSTKESGLTSFNALSIAQKFIIDFGYKILITAPISKQSLKFAGKNFTGHTELISSWFGSKNYLMTFISKNFKAALLTIHVPINSVSKLLTKDSLFSKLNIFHESLKKDFGLINPSIAVLGLNPHAGESGNIGKEEINVILPILRKMRNKNIHGPFVSDAFFANHNYKNFDGVFGMYHDQVLIPFKMNNFNNGVNFTAGLPIIRTSPDHGTAFDIAWQNKADENSMINAIKIALKVLKNRST